MRRLLILAPLSVFLALAAVFALQLMRGGNTTDVPSVLIGTKAPVLNLEALPKHQDAVLSDDFLAKLPPEYDVIALNVWASWCVPCRAEHPQIEAMAELQGVAMVGLNYKDQSHRAEEFLAELGDPYMAIGADMTGATAIEYGVYGVPETFLIDREGVIRHKFVGPITGVRFELEVKPAIASIRGDG